MKLDWKHAPHSLVWARWILAALTLSFMTTPFASQAKGQAKLQITFLDDDTGKPISARFEHVDPKKAFRPKGALAVGRWILVEGETRWSPPQGNHLFRVFRGPEFDILDGGLTVEANAEDSKTIRIKHRTPLSDEGWFSGDLLAALPSDTLSRWQRADGLNVVSTTLAMGPEEPKKPLDRKAIELSKNDKLHEGIAGYWDRRPGSGLLLHNYRPSESVPVDDPSSKLLVQAKRDPHTIAEIQALWARDVPIWLASRRIDTVQLLSDHLLPDQARSMQGIRNPDEARFRGTKGLGRLVESIYWQMLEAGLRIAPSAGSGFGQGKLDTHLGYNRIYVQVDGEPNADEWWKGLVAGRSFVTNGPLLRATIHDHPPGYLFQASQGQKIPLEIDLKLAVRDRVEYLDVIHNHRTLYQARLEQHMEKGRFPDLEITESGWLLIRVVTEHDKSYRLATTAPFYFEFDSKPRISRKAVEFFQTWLENSASEIGKDAQAKARHQPYLDAARKFWQQQLEASTTE